MNTQNRKHPLIFDWRLLRLTRLQRLLLLSLTIERVK